MAKCIFTGEETNLKWKNYPIHPYVMQFAKELKKEYDERHPDSMDMFNMRDAINRAGHMMRESIQKEFNKQWEAETKEE